jgi:adenylate cyclase
MRIGIRLALSAVVLGCIGLSALAVHGLWHRTADSNSRDLARTLNQQIASAVKSELNVRIASAEAAFAALRTILVENVIDTREADKRQFVFLSQIQAQPTLSWISFGWPDGAFFGAHRLSDENLEMVEITADAKDKSIVDRYRFLPTDIEFEKRTQEDNAYDVTTQPWYRDAMDAKAPRWMEAIIHPTHKRAAITYAGPIDIYTKRQGALAVMIEYDRLARFLARLTVGRAGAAFILASDGHIIAGPDPKADSTRGMELSGHPLFDVITQAGTALRAKMSAAAMADLRIPERDTAYQVAITPLGFRDWHVVIAIPEQEFLGKIEETTTRLGLLLVGLVILAGLASVLLARRLIAEPLRSVVGDLKHVENFELDRIAHRPSRLDELDALSSALVRVRAGLAAFGRYLPTDLVRMLVAEGIEAKPGGTMRPLTILFADVAGFTGLSERLGDKIVPLIGRYLDAASQAVDRERGTIDKFIGDAVMAFWGAPHANPDHARDACRGALALKRAVAETGIMDDKGQPLKVRIGLNSGTVLVGNIGSERRLNYTVIGDAVNVASRLEGINKLYGTSILMGEETRRLVGNAIVAREVDRIAVFGRMQGIAIYEVISAADSASLPSWAKLYQEGLALYRARLWPEATALFEQVLAERDDGPSRFMIERCQALIASPPGDDWTAVTIMDAK